MKKIAEIITIKDKFVMSAIISSILILFFEKSTHVIHKICYIVALIIK